MNTKLNEMTTMSRTLKWPRVISLTTLIALSIPTLAFAAESFWRQSGFDPAHTQYNADETVLTPATVTGLKSLWTSTLGGYVGPVAVTSTVIACHDYNRISAFNPDSGALTWNTSGFGSSNCLAPAYNNNTLYTTTSDITTHTGHLLAFDAGTGMLLKDSVSTEFSLGFNTPTYADGVLYVADFKSTVYAFDATTGTVRWKAHTRRYNNAASVANGKVFVTSWTGNVPNWRSQIEAFDAATGAALWTHATDTSNIEYPAVTNGNSVYIATDSGKVIALNSATGAVLWTVKMGSYISAELSLANGVLYIANSGSVTALNASDGSKLWNYTVSYTPVESNMVVANGVIYFTMSHEKPYINELFALDSATGFPLFSRKVYGTGTHSAIAVANGKVYINNFSGSLQVLGLKSL